MEKSDLDQIKNKINFDLDSQIISGRTLLDRLCVIEESSRKTAAYLDNKYAPFYYYIGRYLKAKSLLEIGFNIGLLSSCFLLSCTSVETFFGFKENTNNEFIPIRIGKANIKKTFKKNKNFYIGKLYDKNFIEMCNQIKWDVVIINEEQSYDKHLQYLETVWGQLSENGIIIVDYIKSHKPSKTAFDIFCQEKSINPYLFETRYGTGIIVKN